MAFGSGFAAWTVRRRGFNAQHLFLRVLLPLSFWLAGDVVLDIFLSP